MGRLEQRVTLFGEALAALEEAIAKATKAWQCEPTPGEWSPRRTAEHVIGAVLIYLDFAGEALGREGFDWANLAHTYTRAGEARRALARARSLGDVILVGLDEQSLDLDVPAMGDHPHLPTTVEGVLLLVTGHLRQHSQQILDAASAT